MDYTRFDVPLFCDSQKQKDCKKTTPDFIAPNKDKGITQEGFQMGDTVAITDVVSLVNKKVLNGEFKLDSYDKYDNTCYVLGVGTMTWNVLLSDITFVSGKKV